MIRQVSNSYVGQTVTLDGQSWESCSFTRCKIVVTRGNFAAIGCRFDSCSFELQGEAANLRAFFQFLDESAPSRRAGS